MNKYTLMNKNKELVDVKINENGLIDEVIEVNDIKYLPVGIDNDKDIKAQLNKWWHNRSIPASRDGLNYILHTYDVETPQALSAKSLGLSLSDQYWLKPVGNTIEWKDVNFFTNEFSGDLGNAFFERSQSKKQLDLRSPDASSNGWLKKKWVIIDGERYLFKAGSVPLLQQPYNEVAASKILEILNIPHVKYEIKLEDNRPLCYCKNFITPDTEYVPALQIRNATPKLNHESEYAHFLKCCDKLKIPGAKEFIDNILIVDYIIENTDRHYGNFGFIRDVNTLEFVGPAPIFDNGTSLWSEALNSEIGDPQKVVPFKSSQQEQIKLVKSFKHIDDTKLKLCSKIVYDVLSTSPYLDKERVEKISRAVGNRARLLEHIIEKKKMDISKRRNNYDLER